MAWIELPRSDDVKGGRTETPGRDRPLLLDLLIVDRDDEAGCRHLPPDFRTVGFVKDEDGQTGVSMVSIIGDEDGSLRSSQIRDFILAVDLSVGLDWPSVHRRCCFNPAVRCKQRHLATTVKTLPWMFVHVLTKPLTGSNWPINVSPEVGRMAVMAAVLSDGGGAPYLCSGGARI
ncbi:hypothetical protein ACLOJK_007481 [Asimina triloba]